MSNTNLRVPGKRSEFAIRIELQQMQVNGEVKPAVYTELEQKFEIAGLEKCEAPADAHERLQSHIDTMRFQPVIIRMPPDSFLAKPRCTCCHNDGDDETRWHRFHGEMGETQKEREVYPHKTYESMEEID